MSSVLETSINNIFNIPNITGPPNVSAFVNKASRHNTGHLNVNDTSYTTPPLPHPFTSCSLASAVTSDSQEQRQRHAARILTQVQPASPTHTTTCTTSQANNDSVLDLNQVLLTSENAQILASIIDNDLQMSRLQHYNLSNLIHTGKFNSTEAKQDIFKMIFHTTENIKSPNLTIQIALNSGELTSALIDSGSDYNLVHKDLVMNLPLHTDNLPNFTTANGKSLKVIGKTKLLLIIMGHEFLTDFFVLDDLATQILLGNKFLIDRKVLLDYDKCEITLSNDNQQIKIPMNKQWACDLQKTRILLAQETRTTTTLEIRAKTEAVIGPKQHLRYRELLPQEITMEIETEPNLLNKSKLHVYVNQDPDTKLHYLTIYNDSCRDKWLKKETLIGYFKPPQLNEAIERNIVQNKSPALQNGKITVLDNNSDELNINPDLTIEQHNMVAKMLQKYKDCFTNKTEDLTEAKVNPVRIRIKENAEPFFIGPYKQSPKERDQLQHEIQKLVDAKVLEVSTGYTQFCSPLFLVTNTDGSKRVISDLRKVNAILLKDKFPMPSCDLILNSLNDCNYFCKLDLKNAFFQIPIDPRDRHYLTVSTQTNKYCFTKLPQGMATSSIIFQREIMRILSPYLYSICLPYIDDIIVKASSFEEELTNLETILKELQKFNFKLNTSKTRLMYQQIDILGHSVSQSGIMPLKSNVEAITKYKSPSTIKELRSFLGATNFFRKHIKQYAKLTLPLTDAIKSYNQTKQFLWDSKCEQAFRDLKNILTTPPILSHFKDNRITNIHVDASDKSIGGAITQTDENGRELPIVYVSRKLKPSECLYSVSEKEFLSLVYIITKFREYTYGRELNVYTDHYSLKFYKNFKGVSSRLTRLSMLLADYDLNIIYKAGREHALPDFLSRNPVDDKTIEPDIIPEYSVNLLHEVDLKALQSQDDDLKHIISAILDYNSATQKYKNIAKDYKIQHGILYRKLTQGMLDKYVVALPKSLRTTVLEEFHDSKFSGHLNSKKVYDNVRQRFHWRGMKKDIEYYVKTCDSCQKRKYITKKPYGLLHGVSPTSRVWERIQIDVLGPVTPSNRYRYILTITESLTRYAFAFPLVTADAKSIAKCLIKLFCTYGVASIIMSDRGTEFTASIIQQLNLAIGTCHIFASTFTPQIMGQVERWNGVLCSCLSHYVHETPSKWSQLLDFIVFAYNNSVNQIIGYKPAYLLLNYNPQLPSDTIFVTPNTDPELMENLKMVDHIRSTIPTILKSEHEKQKKYYDQAHRAMPELQPGTEVLLSYPKNLQLNPSKFSRMYRGPVTILKKVTPVSYLVELIKNGRLAQEVVHVSRMKIYHTRKEDW